MVPPTSLIQHYISKFSTQRLTFTPDFIETIVSIVATPTEIRNCVRILANRFKDEEIYELSKKDLGIMEDRSELRGLPA